MKRFQKIVAGFVAVLGFVTALGVARDAMGFVVVRRSVAYRPVAVHPVATAAVVGATAVAVGTMVRTLPPSCQTVLVGNVAYQQCGGTYYEPRYAGSQVTYVVVNPPR